MRITTGFTDGRIHVTLYEGAYDLKALSLEERRSYNAVLSLYVGGYDLVALELVYEREHGGSESVQVLYEDLCRRLALSELREAEGMEDGLCPWRPARTREFVEAVLA